jgi:XTP/dITP diphosphohydrolase
MFKLLLATQNQGKVAEMKALLFGLPVEVITPDSMFDVEETGTTFEENARLKAKAFSDQYHLVAVADDSGLVVDALDGRPGVYSKRYGNSDEDRNQKLLSELKNVPDELRSARFVSVIALVGDGFDQSFRGEVEGKIAFEVRGSGGFGYDPLFIPMGYTQTFGEVGSEVKNQLSHRSKAIQKMKDFLAKNIHPSSE